MVRASRIIYERILEDSLKAVDVYVINPISEIVGIEKNLQLIKEKHDDAKLTDVGSYMKKNYHFTKHFIYRNGSDILWPNVAFFAFVHLILFYVYFMVVYENAWKTAYFTYSFGVVLALGVTAGAHRFYTHRSYKAKWPLRLFLILTHTITGMKDMHNWVRDHRVHHKFSETDADPHNSKRGWFFAHIGWLMVKKHPDVRLKGQTIDCSDIFDDPIAKFQSKYYVPLFLLCSAITVAIPMVLWGETFKTAFLLTFVARWVTTIHYAGFINSAAHIIGDRPYDQKIGPSENVFVSYFTLGEGCHNYHHTFPWDYSGRELNSYVDLTTIFINFMADIGQVYDRKRVAPDIVQNRKQAIASTNGHLAMLTDSTGHNNDGY